MPNLRGLQQFHENDVINFFKVDASLPVLKGTFVKVLSGVMSDQYPVMAGSPGLAVANTVSQRYSVQPSVQPVTATGDATLGMLLYDTRETDENGEKLHFNPRKAVEMECAVSGQAVPIVTKGVFSYSGISGTVAAGSALFLAGNGELIAAPSTSVATRVGTALGPKDANGFAIIKVNLDY